MVTIASQALPLSTDPSAPDVWGAIAQAKVNELVAGHNEHDSRLNAAVTTVNAASTQFGVTRVTYFADPAGSDDLLQYLY